MARALVLGGAGFVGAHLASRLADEGHELTLVDDLSRGRDDATLTALCARPGVRFVQADLTTPGALNGLPRQWDQVYMLAAVVGVRNVERDPARVVRTNTLALMTVLDWLPGAGETLFFSSTSEVYAGSVGLDLAPVPTPETVPLAIADVAAPRSAYAISKILGEAAVIHAGRARGRALGHRALSQRVRPSHGRRSRHPRDGAAGHPARGSLPRVRVPATAGVLPRRGRGRGDPAPDHDRRGGRARSSTSATTATRRSSRISPRSCAGAPGYAPALERLPAPAGSPERRCPDLTRLHALTGVTPKVSLETGVGETLDWYRAWWEREGGGR